MRLIIALVSLCSVLQDVPFKSGDEFELNLDLSFRPRPHHEKMEFTVNRTSSPLPFLAMQLNVLKVLEDEYRVKVQDSKGNVLANKLLSKGASLKFDLGYTDDLKDHVTTHSCFIRFYDRSKNAKRSIVIRFDRDGTYYVNDQVRGRI